jgi:selT/selW/selH-like putative selenoprotein
LAARIARELSIEPTLVEGRGGVFDVVVDGNRVFSKRSAHRFPEPEEILDAIRAKRPYGG